MLNLHEHRAERRGCLTIHACNPFGILTLSWYGGQVRRLQMRQGKATPDEITSCERPAE